MHFLLMLLLSLVMQIILNITFSKHTIIFLNIACKFSAHDFFQQDAHEQTSLKLERRLDIIKTCAFQDKPQELLAY